MYVPLYLQSVQGVANFDMTVAYDSSVLTPVQQDNGEYAVWETEKLDPKGMFASAVKNGAVK